MELGTWARDIITGFEGIIIGKVTYITGCDQYLLQPKVKDGAHVDSRWIDEGRLQVVDASPVDYIALVFASGERTDDGELVTVQQEFTYSMHENAKLRAFVQQWRGKPYASDAEAATLRLAAMEGAAGLVNVAHKTSKQGREYAVIVSISPLVKGMPKPVVEGYTRPAFWQTRKEEYARLAAPHMAPRPGNEHDLSDFPQALDDDDDSSLPF